MTNILSTRTTIVIPFDNREPSVRISPHLRSDTAIVVGNCCIPGVPGPGDVAGTTSSSVIVGADCESVRSKSSNPALQKKNRQTNSASQGEETDEGGTSNRFVNLYASIRPLAGRILVHGHGHRCLTHEASAVTGGIKHVLRTDIVYK